MLIARLSLSEQAHKRDGFSAVFWPGWEWWLGRREPDPKASKIGGKKPVRDGRRASISRISTVSGFLRGFFFFFKLENNCFTMLFWFLLPNNVNQPCVYLHSLLLSLPSSLIPASRSSRSTVLCSLSSTAASHSLSSLHLVVYKCQTNVPIHLQPPLPTVYPHIHSLRLHLYCCPGSRFTFGIFLDSPYID